MNLLRIDFDDGTSIAVQCEHAEVSPKGVRIVGGKGDGTFYDDAHGAELISMGASEEKAGTRMTLTDELTKRLLEILGANYAAIEYAKMAKDGKKLYVCPNGCRSTKKEKIKWVYLK